MSNVPSFFFFNIFILGQENISGNIEALKSVIAIWPDKLLEKKNSYRR